MTSYQSQLEKSIDMIVDTCVYYEGQCEKCELKEFCECEKPIDYVD